MNPHIWHHAKGMFNIRDDGISLTIFPLKPLIKFKKFPAAHLADVTLLGVYPKLEPWKINVGFSKQPFIM